MTIARLISDLNQQGINPEIIEEPSGPYLNDRSPALVDEDGKIRILNTLEASLKEQAIAHELAHQLIHSMGIPPIKQQNEPIDYLFLEINNAISHPLLVEILRNQYMISSEYHLSLRRNSIEDIEDLIKWARGEGADAPIFLVAFGLRLYDVQRTIPEVTEAVELVVASDPLVLLSYQNAFTYFSDISIGIGMIELEAAIRNFLDSVGIPISFQLN